MKTSWYIRGGAIIDPVAGTETVADLFISDGLITNLPSAIPPGAGIIEAGGLILVPGFIDVHVHLREPGNEAAETIESGSRAAAKGGFTAVVAMPNTTPPIDEPDMISQVLEAGGKHRLVDVLPSGCITKGRCGKEVAGLRAMAAAGAVAFTDDGATVTDDSVMADAMKICRDLDKCILDHALDPAIAGKGIMHEGEQSRRLHFPGIPSLAESRMVERDIRLAEETGCAVHIQHISARESVVLIRKAIERGLRVSGEATPHHIALNDSDVVAENADFKMNPPVRSEDDRLAIISAVADGTLQIIATDHAPHTEKDKEKGFFSAPFGVVGLETAVGISYSCLVKTGAMSLTEWVRRWTTGPAKILGLPAPQLKTGRPANLAILDLNSTWTVNSTDFLSKSRNTPFEGRMITGRAVYTFLNGVLTWNDVKRNDIVDTTVKI